MIPQGSINEPVRRLLSELDVTIHNSTNADGEEVTVREIRRAQPGHISSRAIRAITTRDYEGSYEV